MRLCPFLLRQQSCSWCPCVGWHCPSSTPSATLGKRPLIREVAQARILCYPGSCLTHWCALARILITVLVGLAGAAAASITEIHRVALQQFPTEIKENSICCFIQHNSDPHHWVFHLTQHNRDNDDRSADLEEDCLSVLPAPTPVKSNRHLTSCCNTNALTLAHTHHRKAAIFS